MADSDDMALSIVPEGAVPDYYADSFRFGASALSVFMEFQQAEPREGGTTPLVRPLFKLYMSPHFAKLMSAVLARNMDAWEKANGPLQLPDHIMSQIK